MHPPVLSPRFRLCTLVPLVATVTWACQDAPNVTEPGVLLDGLELVAAMAGQGAGHGPPRFVVTLAAGVSPELVAGDHGVAPDHVYHYVLNGFAGAISDAARTGLMRDRRVVGIDRDVLVTAADQPAASWGLDRVDQRASALDNTYSFDVTGAGVTAYVIDSGIRYSHAEFEGRASLGFDFLGGDGSDCSGHGTHVAGTIGGKTYGIAKDVELVSLRVLNCHAAGYVSYTIAAMDWVAANASGPSVANISITLSDRYRPMDTAVRDLTRSGVPVVVAAGNFGGDACDYSPAAASQGITVAATNAQDTRPSWSNWGKCVDLFAPGEAISSASHSDDFSTAVKYGTSMAAPHVAGAVALYLEENPAASPSDVTATLTARATQGIVGSANSQNDHLLLTRDPGNLGQPDPPPPPPPGVTLTANGHKTKGLHVIDLTWAGAAGTNVSVFVNGSTLAQVPNGGGYSIQTGAKGKATYVVEVCELEGAYLCSNSVTVSF